MGKSNPLTVIEVASSQANLYLRDSTDAFRVREPYKPKARPFLKWAGGKQWMIPIADALLPADFLGTYYEPFVGGGALFFALAPEKTLLSDANEHLISSYRAVRDSPSKVITRLQKYPHSKEFFEKMRSTKPRTPYTVAARLIYLNKTAWNGLYRVSREGHFNVPFGRYENPSICNEDRLRAASKVLKGTRLRACAFESAVKSAGEGDLVYFDPPYITGHSNNGFHKYNAHLFDWSGQIRLAELSGRLRDSGVHVIVSNAHNEDLIRLYKHFYRYTVVRRSSIAGVTSSRGKAQEVLLSSFELFDMPGERVRG